MITRTTKITIETEGVLVVRQGRTVITWCPECKAEVEAMLCDDAFLVQLLAGIRAGSLHVWRSADSTTQICLPSVLQISQSSKVIQQPHIRERRLPKEGERQ